LIQQKYFESLLVSCNHVTIPPNTMGIQLKGIYSETTNLFDKTFYGSHRRHVLQQNKIKRGMFVKTSHTSIVLCYNSFNM
jgi:hypothetical protein